jgi:transcriptional regulator
VYNPSHYQTTDDEIIFNIVNERGFGALITPGSEGLSITHLPVAVDESSKQLTEVWGHVARANLHWRSWKPGVRSILIIEGEDAYVSPA